MALLGLCKIGKDTICVSNWCWNAAKKDAEELEEDEEEDKDEDDDEWEGRRFSKMDASFAKLLLLKRLSSEAKT